jgi:hypothetical protein
MTLNTRSSVRWRRALRSLAVLVAATAGLFAWTLAVVFTRRPGESPADASDRALFDWPAGAVAWVLIAVLLLSLVRGCWYAATSDR